MAELVQYECSRCGSRLQVMARAEVKCRCGAQMKPAARDLNPMGMAQPARAPVVEAVAGLVQRSMFDAMTESQPARRAQDEFPNAVKRGAG